MLKKRLLLLGGGHSHALLIKRLGMKPIAHVEVILVSPSSLTPYSGMLPGHLAGIYSHEEMHIDLVKLCTASGVKFIQAAALRIDKDQKKIHFANRPAMVFDVLSINVGSVPVKEEWGLGIKPMQDFLDQWSRVESAQSIAVIGGGAGGVEVALSLQTRFAGRKKISLIHRDVELLLQAPRGLRQKITKICQAKGVHLHLNEKNAAPIAQTHDLVLWTTQARGPDLLRTSGLKLDARGFLLTDDKLICLGEESIFAVGDCGLIQDQHRARSGVYAVRLAQPLEDNIRRLFSGRPLQRVKLQKKHLSLITTGGREAIAIRGPFYWQASWIWPLKNRIDCGFMEKFKNLPPALMPMHEDDLMRCLGCGAKVDGVALKSVLGLLAKDYPEVFHDTEASQSLAMSEDVALVHVQGWMMQSLDYFPAFIDDLFLLGKIACLHATGDLLAKGGVPQSCLALAVLTHKAPELLKDDLYQVLAGIASVLQTMGARLIGGHSAEGKQLAVGLQIQGQKPSAEQWKPKSGLRAGDHLVLTKALGTGLVLAGLMRQLSKGSWVDRCKQSMLLNHYQLLPLIAAVSVHGATDVTGFGLLGHLAEMVHSSAFRVTLQSSHLPLLPGVKELIAQGVQSTLALDNQAYAASLCGIENGQETALLCDPQTSGAFLLSIAADQAEDWVKKARQAGFMDCCVIGEVRAGEPGITIL